MEKIETKNVIVESFNTDFQRRMNYETLGRDLLNCAEQHANKRGFGVDDITPKNHAWVLSRMAIEMYEMPKMFTELEISTWIENIYRLFTNRNFAIRGIDGKEYGYARSIWAMIDRTTRQPIELERLYAEEFNSCIIAGHPCPIAPQTRLRPLKDTEECRIHKVVTSDIDYNGHVNSIKYIQLLCDVFPLEYYQKHKLQRVEIAYINETLFGETLHFFKQEIEDRKFEIEIRKDEGETVVRGLLCFA